MKTLILSLGFLTSLNAFAAPAQCRVYTATLTCGGDIKIESIASDYLQGHGYTYVQTSITGAVSKTCESFYLGGRPCGLKVTNVKEISVDCADQDGQDDL
jgi:hypothetical protein